MVTNVNFGYLTASDTAAVSYNSNPFALLQSNDIFADFLKLYAMNPLNGNNSSLFSSYAPANITSSPSAYAYNYKPYTQNKNLPSLNETYNPAVGQKLLNNAKRASAELNSKGYCARGVNNAIQYAGLANGETRVAAAHMEADVLANHKNFKEIYVRKEDLKSLPAGCVICWNRAPGGSSDSDKYGHIAVTDGNGGEYSDHHSNLKILNKEYRVFVPVSTNGVNA